MDDSYRDIVIADETDEVPPDEVLLAYRRGGLSNDESKYVESLLGRSYPARKRLTELGSGEMTRTPAEFLASLEFRKRVRFRRSLIGIAASLLIGLAFLAAGYLRFRPETPEPAARSSDWNFGATVRSGLAKERNEGEGMPVGVLTRVPVSQKTFLEITFEPPAEGAPQGLDFALYRDLGPALERVRGVAATQADGCTILSGEAGKLAGPEERERVIHLVVSSGAFPSKITISDRDAREELSALGDWVGSIVLEFEVPTARLKSKGGFDEKKALPHSLAPRSDNDRDGARRERPGSATV